MDDSAESLGKFFADFNQVADLARQAAGPVVKGRALLTALDDHLGVSAAELSCILEEFAPHRLVDVDILLSEIVAADPAAQLLGIGGGDQRNHMSLSDMIQQSLGWGHLPLARPDFSNIPIGPASQRQVVTLGLHLFTHGDTPMAVLQRAAAPQFGRQRATLELLAADPEAVANFLTELRTALEVRSVFKGQVVSFTMNDFGANIGGVTFLPRPHLNSADVVLPDGVLERVENHTLGIGRAADVLSAHGQHLKRGLLLYGPPGTGKTHTVRYLMGRSDGTTVIILSGGTLARVSEAATMARALAPSIVVLEDCDLIAEDRSFSYGPQPLLFEVLDAMDGLDKDADVAFVLTTNRVDMLERALAQRPGRVDLAVEIPLPSERERTGLLALYSHGIGFSPRAIAAAAARTAGTTASFAKELIRRAVVAAALAGQLPSDAELDAAATQLMADSEALTRSLLGSSANGRGQDRGGPTLP